MNCNTNVVQREEIPDELLDKYLKMLIEDSWNLKFIPEEHRITTLCDLAISNAQILPSNTQTVLTFVPRQFRTEDLCLRAVDIDGAALRDVPDEVKTYDICYRAIRHNGTELDCVPYRFLDEQMCLAAVSDDGEALRSVPEHLKTEELCWIAMRTRPDLIDLVPLRFRTRELYVYLWRRVRKGDISTIRQGFPEEVWKAAHDF